MSVLRMEKYGRVIKRNDNYIYGFRFPGDENIFKIIVSEDERKYLSSCYLKEICEKVNAYVWTLGLRTVKFREDVLRISKKNVYITWRRDLYEIDINVSKILTDNEMDLFEQYKRGLNVVIN